jgi:hypothetical protein
MNALSVLAALLLLAAPAAATERPTFVTTYASQPGETMDAFVLRIAGDAVERSMAIGVSGEICGEIRRDGDGFVVDTYTIRRIAQCSYLRRRGYDYTGLTFHTHVFIGETNAHLLSQKLNNPRFSEEDYAHPGYMVSGRLVTFQRGRGTERRVR